MALLDININLHGAKGSAAAMTHRGMAHFAGSGPVGATCGGCKHWQLIGEKARSRVCAKARQFGTRCHTAIPATAPACKYFEKAGA